ncbi:DarT ssDNA thymidine ADP-ribosyltransferase family protein [Chromatium okenii]|jgi:hypothetical protein|uniref:DarT domain-containing protein n=1 Tax=Chromatium okenii TaxID=61644 RepID=A0A2S7XTE8_9GAMM|nr:DarT ssDNA thymidine ADP-ribosyltransferase family protein [Chromatium okenii]MBV5310657.1 DUF4433 domain-containing protein [Chromatium okenii]PQJ97009.1 hypothetical protein CXB77_03105 [Chromatium okenii]
MTPEELICYFNIKHLYHFTDVANLDSIRLYGGIYSLKQLEQRQIVSLRPGGNQWSHDADRRRGLHQYVHLSFMDTHPMCYAAEKERRIGPTATLRIHPNVLMSQGTMFTSDVANKSGIVMLSLVEAVEKIDFEVIYNRTDWSDPVIQDRRRQARKAEALIPEFIPLQMIGNI